MSKLSKPETIAKVKFASEYLGKLINTGDTVYTCLRHVSASGMARDISLHIISDGRIVDISGTVSHLLCMKCNVKNGGIRINGCGMDMGFALVYDLSSTLFNGNDRVGYVLHHSWL
jgi:hypothetical protein